MPDPRIKELLELRAANEAAEGWGAAVGARLERIRHLEGELGMSPKKPAYEVAYRVPAGCHLVSLYHYTRERIRTDQKGYYAHLIMTEGWYDDEGQSLYGTSITGGYHPDPQSAIDDAYAKVLAHVAKVNEEIPLRKAKFKSYLDTLATPPDVKKEADDLLKFLGI